jgi:PAS domain-containing protein
MDELWWAAGAALDDASGRALFESLIDALPMAVVLAERGGGVVAVNRCYRELFGRLPPPELNALEDPIARRLGADALFRRVLEGESVRRPAAAPGRSATWSA